MAVVFPHEGRRLAAERITGKKHNGFGGVATGVLAVRLFSDFAPSVTSAFADFPECAFSGYAAVPLAVSSWTSAQLNTSNQAYAVYPGQVWTHNGGAVDDQANGYYVTTYPPSGDDKVLFYETFDQPKYFTESGHACGVGLVLKMAPIVNATAMTTPAEGLPLLLNKLTGKIACQVALGLRLFRNNPAIDIDSVLDDFDVANFSGYTDQSMPFSGWQVALLNASSRGQISQSAVNIFENSGGGDNNTISGYVVYESGKVLWCEEFEEARSVTGDDPFLFVQGRFETGVIAV